MPHPIRTPAARAGRSAARRATPRRAAAPSPTKASRTHAGARANRGAALSPAAQQAQPAADFRAQWAQAVGRALPAAATPMAEPTELMPAPAGSGWARLLPRRWAGLWPALRRGAAQVARRPRRELRMAEMLTLSDKRFLAVIRYGQSQFLIGGAQNSIALLSRIEAPCVVAAGHPAMFR
ncbi:MAG: flagellar biosynthetic protein FliO [Terriglobales bacterium]